MPDEILGDPIPRDEPFVVPARPEEIFDSTAAIALGRFASNVYLMMKLLKISTPPLIMRVWNILMSPTELMGGKAFGSVLMRCQRLKTRWMRLSQLSLL